MLRHRPRSRSRRADSIPHFAGHLPNVSTSRRFVAPSAPPGGACAPSDLPFCVASIVLSRLHNRSIGSLITRFHSAAQPFVQPDALRLASPASGRRLTQTFGSKYQMRVKSAALHGHSRSSTPRCPASLSVTRVPTKRTSEVSHGPARSQRRGLPVRWRPAHRLLSLHRQQPLPLVAAQRCCASAFKLRSPKPQTEAVSLGRVARPYFGAAVRPSAASEPIVVFQPPPVVRFRQPLEWRHRAFPRPPTMGRYAPRPRAIGQPFAQLDALRAAPSARKLAQTLGCLASPSRTMCSTR